MLKTSTPHPERLNFIPVAATYLRTHSDASLKRPLLAALPSLTASICHLFRAEMKTAHRKVWIEFMNPKSPFIDRISQNIDHADIALLENSSGGHGGLIVGEKPNTMLEYLLLKMCSLPTSSAYIDESYKTIIVNFINSSKLSKFVLNVICDLWIASPISNSSLAASGGGRVDTVRVEYIRLIVKFIVEMDLSKCSAVEAFGQNIRRGAAESAENVKMY